MNALVLVDARHMMIIDIEVLPVCKRRNRFTYKIIQCLKTFFIHPVIQSFAQVFDDSKAVLHGGSTYLHCARAEEHEFNSILPRADATDARYRNISRCRILADR